MWKVTVKGLLAHKLRLALTALAIVLGVTFISGTLVLTDTLHNTFTTLFGHIYQNVDFEVRAKAAFTGDNGNGNATAQTDPGVDRTRRAQCCRRRLRRGNGSRYRAVRRTGREGDLHRWCTHPRLLLRSQHTALAPPSRPRLGPDHAAPGGHG